MKIQIQNLEPNPFRNIEKYPIDRFKVEALKGSIKETSFWDNILARPKPKTPGKYQIAYGHHRLIALQELGIDEIDIPVRNLSDVEMIKIMANENKEDWHDNPIAIVESIREIRDFLNAELEKYETWEEVEKYPNNLIKVLFSNTKGDWKKARDNGVGQTTILKFLGEPWKQHEIQKALSVITDGDFYNDEIVSEFETITDLDDFHSTITSLNKERESEGKEKLNYNEIKDLAPRVADRKKNIKEKRGKGKFSKPNKIESDIKTITRQELNGDESIYDSKLKDIAIDINRINSTANTLKNNIITLNGELKELGVEEIKNFPMIFDSLESFSSLFSATNRMMLFFGIDFKDKYKKLNN